MSLRHLVSLSVLSSFTLFFCGCDSSDSQKKKDSIDEGSPSEPGTNEPPLGPIEPADDVSEPAVEDPETGGNIVMPKFFDMASLEGHPDRIFSYFRESPEDSYTLSATNLPDGITASVNSEKRTLLVSGTPTAAALAASPYNVELTLANSTDSRTVKFNWHIRDAVVPDPNPSNVTPCGGNPSLGGTLWSWAWAGVNREHLTVEVNGLQTVTTRAEDLSGNDHYYYTATGGYGHGSEPAYTWRKYSTPFPTMGLSNSEASYSDYGPQSMLQNGSLAADKEFYLAAAVMNSRLYRGTREIFGKVDDGNALQYAQGVADPESYNSSGVLWLTMNGDTVPLNPKYSFDVGPTLIEVWRDSDDVVHTRVNGADNTLDGGVALPGLFDLTGLSSNQARGFDDAGFEFIVCKGDTSPSQMDRTRDYLRSKWNLY